MRSRVTITLSPDVLSLVDGSIDGKQIRNRSQAVESILASILKPRVTTAVILAGDAINRFQAPALTDIGGMPLLGHTLELLISHGFNRVLITTTYPVASLLPITERYRDRIDISLFHESHPLGTGGAVGSLISQLHGTSFLLMHGDIYTSINLKDFVAYFLKERIPALVGTKPRFGKSHYGMLMVEGNKVIEFRNQDTETPISLVNTGIYLFSPQVFSLFSKQQPPYRLEDVILPVLAANGQLSPYTFQGVWFDISREEELMEARSKVNLT